MKYFSLVLVFLSCANGSFVFARDVEPKVLDLGTLGGDYSFARDINDDELVVGESKIVTGETHAFLWRDRVMSDLGTPSGMSYSMANGVNNVGDVVGYAKANAYEGLARACLWSRRDGLILLPNLEGQSYAQASDLNDLGDIAGVSGTKAVVWKKGKAYPLESLGGEFSIALGINNRGLVIGNSLTLSGEIHAVLWKDGEAIDLGTLGGRFSTANAINEKNQIVGSSETSDGKVHAFIWEDGVMKDLGPGMIRNLNNTTVLAGERPQEDDDEVSHAITWNSSFDTEFGERLPMASYSSAFGINRSGVSVGVSEIQNGRAAAPSLSSRFRATLWFP